MCLVERVQQLGAAIFYYSGRRTLKRKIHQKHQVRFYSDDNPGNGRVDNSLCGEGLTVPQGGTKSFYCSNAVGRYVFVRLVGSSKVLTLCEVEIYTKRKCNNYY